MTLGYYLNDTNKEGITSRNIINWKDERKALKSKGKECEKCKFNSTCEGVWNEYAKRFGLNELNPIID